VGEKVMQKYLPEIWGGEVGLLIDAYINKGNGFTNTFSIALTSSKQYHNSSAIPKYTPSINSPFYPLFKRALAKCYDEQCSCGMLTHVFCFKFRNES